jgi:non-ribosomal peptide synthetase component F
MLPTNRFSTRPLYLQLRDALAERAREHARPVPARFEDRARRHPDRIAVCTPAWRVTYRQLHSDVDRIARLVVGARGSHSEPVALFLGDDIAMMASLLAVRNASILDELVS